MRSIYLIRHAHPVQIDMRSRCGCAWDTALDYIGIRQSIALSKWAKEKKIESIYTSPMLRAVQTSALVSRGNIAIAIKNDLREMDVGLWEGMPFEEIRQRWPKEYEERGKHIGAIAPPGGESFLQAGMRLKECVTQILQSSKCLGNIAVVSHGGAIRGWLCLLMNLDIDHAPRLRQPWGGITEIKVRDDGIFQVGDYGYKPQSAPDMTEIQRMFAQKQVSDSIRRHGSAVARCALALADKIQNKTVCRSNLVSAALLHDLYRDQKDHAMACAAMLDREGYPQVAKIVAGHHNLPKNANVETQLLYLADKLVQEDKRVGCIVRFEMSRSKCYTPQAVEAFQKRYNAVWSTAAWLGLEKEELYKCDSGEGWL